MRRSHRSPWATHNAAPWGGRKPPHQLRRHRYSRLALVELLWLAWEQPAAVAPEIGQVLTHKEAHNGREHADPPDTAAQESALGGSSLYFDPDDYRRSNLEAVRGTPWDPGTKIHY